MKNLRPARLDMTDMPREHGRVFGSLKAALAASFNHCRKYPYKMVALLGLMEWMVERVKQHIEDQAAFVESQKKAIASREAPEATEEAFEAAFGKLEPTPDSLKAMALSAE